MQTHSRAFIFLLEQTAMRHNTGVERSVHDKKEEKKKEERKRKGTTLKKHATCFHILFNYSTTFKVAPSTGRVAASPLRGFEPQDKT